MRICNLDGQIIVSPGEGYRKFAIYDTVYDRFVIMNDEQVWDSWDDFRNSCENEIRFSSSANTEGQVHEFMDRVEPLIKSAGY